MIITVATSLALMSAGISERKRKVGSHNCLFSSQDRKFWMDWISAWESIEFDLRGFEEEGDTVIVDVHQRNRGKGSGVVVEFDYFQAFRIRDGKLTECRAAPTRDALLGAMRADA